MTEKTMARPYALTSPISRPKATSLQTEFLRKGIHFLIALVPILAKQDRSLTALLLVYGIAFYTLCETLRLNGYHIPFISGITERASRERDQGHFVLGPVSLGLGALLALVFYPDPAASVAIYTLAFGDGLASLVGRHLGRLRPAFLKGKSIEGSLACFSIVLAVVSLLGFSMPVALITATAATIVEALPLKDYDNIILPVTAGFVIELLALFGLN